jgi:hypothetical protein
MAAPRCSRASIESTCLTSRCLALCSLLCCGCVRAGIRRRSAAALAGAPTIGPSALRDRARRSSVQFVPHKKGYKDVNSS